MVQRVTDRPLTLDALLADTAAPECGALAVFAGTVRAQHDGRTVTAISYSAYRPLAEKALAEIEEEARRRFEITSCAIRHRVGELAIGETSVLIVVRAPHRDAAFRAARYAIDTVKQRAPIWKDEYYADGSHAYVQGCALEQAPLRGTDAP